MSKNKDLTDLPSMELDFFFEGVGSITKKDFKGDFAYRMPNTKIQCLIDKHFAFLNGDLAHLLDPGTVKIHRKIAYLRYTLTEVPKFWKDTDLGYELMDHNIIDDVHDTVITFENEWMRQVWGEPEKEEDDGPEEA